MKVESESEVAQSCLTLSDLQPTRLLRLWIFQARVLEWGAIVPRIGEPLGLDDHSLMLAR